VDAEDVVPEEEASIGGTNIGTGESLDMDGMGEHIIVPVNAEGRVWTIFDKLANDGSPRAG
jgi:hypothetical protein